MKKKNPSFFESIEGEVVREAGEYVKDKVKTKLLRIGEISILAILAFILISFGIATILENTFPILSGGFSFILLGVIFLLISFSLKI